MTLVWVAFVLIFAIVQLCTAEYVSLGQKTTIELMINKIHGLSPSGGLVSPSGGFASLFLTK
jgi:hypothetical protein